MEPYEGEDLGILMFARMLTAFVGGGMITVALLLMMNYFANLVTARDPVDYFQITDFIPDDRPSWSRMPEQPPAPQRPPERPRIDFDPLDEPPRIDSPVYIPETPRRPNSEVHPLQQRPSGIPVEIDAHD